MLQDAIGNEHQLFYLSQGRAFGIVDTALPSNVVPPLVTPEFGPTYTSIYCQEGAWTNARYFAYQWLKDGATVWGASESHYSTTYLDDGATFTCLVTASNSLGGISVLSSNACFIGEHTMLQARDGSFLEDRADEIIRTRVA